MCFTQGIHLIIQVPEFISEYQRKCLILQDNAFQTKVTKTHGIHSNKMFNKTKLFFIDSALKENLI